MKEKKNILFLINNLGGGGAEKVLVNLVNQMSDSEYNITLRTLFDQGENKRYLSKRVNYEYIFKKSFKGVNYLHFLPKKWVYNKVTHGDFDVIIVYLHGVLTKIVSYAPESQKTIAYLHANMENSPFIKSFKSKEKLQKCFKTYDAIVSVSQSVEDSFKKVSSITEKLHVIYNTFDVDGIREKARENCDFDKGNTQKLKICSVGKLTKVKGYERLLAVASKLRNEGFDFELIILGEGAERKSLENIIEQENLKNNVYLIGHKTNPYNYMLNSDLFVSSSYSEGFSSVVAESIILGIPVLTTDTAGMKEILGKNNEYGMVVENSEDALYNGLKNILKDKNKIAYYTEKAKERSIYFSPQKTVNDVENLINNLTE